MLRVSPLCDKTHSAVEKLFTEYYTELDCGENIPHLLEEYILPDIKSGLVRAELLTDNDTPAGFILYQTDDVGNEWNLREGWGDVREIFVIPSLRRNGYGRFLLYTAEMKLRESGTHKAYCLPVDGTESFFTACGYQKSSLYNEELDCFVYEKPTLSNKCK